uniref:Uncharacterized protein n=1 Tax=Oryza punctata TaxID=4537 RepID=A0A0E0JRD9_ORYPU
MAPPPRTGPHAQNVCVHAARTERKNPTGFPTHRSILSSSPRHPPHARVGRPHPSEIFINSVPTRSRSQPGQQHTAPPTHPPPAHATPSSSLVVVAHRDRPREETETLGGRGRLGMDLYGAAAGGVAVARRPWSKVEDKVFESALVLCPEDVPDRWALVAAQLPGRTPQEALEHYQVLVADIDLIMRGAIDAPGSWDDNTGNDRRRGGGGKPRGEERRRGVPWSEDEHRLFLEGLDRYGRGDWRNISRFSVRTRTPTQVASHAQKYFIRQANAGARDSKRKSIHDITTP